MKEKRARVPLRLIRLAPVGAMLLMLSAPTAMADSAQAETGEISKTVYGAGAVQPASPAYMRKSTRR